MVDNTELVERIDQWLKEIGTRELVSSSEAADWLLDLRLLATAEDRAEALV